LQSDFQALVSALNPSTGSGAGTGTSNGAPTLSGFLQTLVSDLGGSSANATTATTGALVNATA
jgi:hypothetical protein